MKKNYIDGLPLFYIHYNCSHGGLHSVPVSLILRVVWNMSQELWGIYDLGETINKEYNLK